MSTNYHTALTDGQQGNATNFNAPLGQLDAAITDIRDGCAFTGAITGTAATFSGQVQAATFVGNGAGLTGITGATGGISNTGSTTIEADSDANGVGDLVLRTGGVTRIGITAAGVIALGELEPTRKHAVYAMGDSLTSTTYTNKLLALLGSHWAVRNQGLAGNRANQMAARLTAECITPGDGEFIVIWGGINDVAADRIAADIETDLQTMYTAAAAAGMTVIACTLTPFKNSSSYTAGRQTVLDAVNAWIAGSATGVDYVVDTFELLEDGSTDTLAAAYDSGDHLHLSTAGYELVATTIYNAVTWTPDAANATLTVSGDVALAQSLLPTSDVAFHNIHASGAFDAPFLRPATDSTTALRVTNAAGSSILMTFDTTNHVIGIGTASPDATKLVSAEFTHYGASYATGINFLGGKADASGVTVTSGISSQTYGYAMSASSTASFINALSAKIGCYSASGKTSTISYGSAVFVDSPGFSGTGTNAITNGYGVRIYNQGHANVTTAMGLKIEDQSGAATNWALYTGAGQHQIGSATATLGFYGVTPIARALLATGAGATVDNVITALQNLGLVKQS